MAVRVWSKDVLVAHLEYSRVIVRHRKARTLRYRQSLKLALQLERIGFRRLGAAGSFRSRGFDRRLIVGPPARRDLASIDLLYAGGCQRPRAHDCSIRSDVQLSTGWSAFAEGDANA